MLRKNLAMNLIFLLLSFALGMSMGFIGFLLYKMRFLSTHLKRFAVYLLLILVALVLTSLMWWVKQQIYITGVDKIMASILMCIAGVFGIMLGNKYTKSGFCARASNQKNNFQDG